MTTYVVSATQTSQYNMVIKANAYEIRIVQVNFWGVDGGVFNYIALRYDPGTTMSGGSAISIAPTRQNAPAASATAQQGPTSATFSSTPVCIGSTVLPPGQTTGSSGTTITHTYPGAAAQITFPLPAIIAPGGLINFQGYFLTTIGADIYFEELRLTGSY